jgi:hypothetical protein
MDIIYQNNSIREFAKYCFSYFFQNDWQKVISLTDSSPALINGVSFVSHDLDVFKRLIGAFTTIQTKASLTSANTLRYFEDPIFINKNTYYYFTTQWNGEGDYSLSFKNIKSYFEDNYPKFQIIRKNQNYCLIIDAHDPIGKFQIKEFQMSLQSAGLQNLNKLSARFTASLLTKPFVILTGLSGSGKTKLAQAFVQWICKEKSQYHSDSSDPNELVGQIWTAT